MGAIPERTNDRNPPLAQGRATRIAQMTHHLMRSHPAPPAFAARRECLNPTQDFRPSSMSPHLPDSHPRNCEYVAQIRSAVRRSFEHGHSEALLPLAYTVVTGNTCIPIPPLLIWATYSQFLGCESVKWGL